MGSSFHSSDTLASQTNATYIVGHAEAVILKWHSNKQKIENENPFSVSISVRIISSLLSCFLAFFIGLTAFGQEYQSNLGKNPTYRTHNYKSVGINDNLCGVNTFLDFAVVETIRPECNSDNGSISIQVSSTDVSFEYFLNGELIDANSNSLFSFDNLSAGAYTVKVVGNEGNVCEQFIILSNIGLDLIEVEARFNFSPAYCGPGKMTKNNSIETEQITYYIFNSNNELIDSCLTISFPKCELDLEVGAYYVQRVGSASNCQAFYPFEIQEVPSTFLPFEEDFAAELIYPSSRRWADKQAYVNRTFPIDPLSIGVATLDGLDEFGFPYAVSNLLVDGPADSLTSLPFCLDNVTITDSLYLSFYFQPEGNGDIPNEVDSLIVEIKDNQSNWHQLWAYTGAQIEEDSTVSKDQFTFVSLSFADDSTFTGGQTFFETGFQFRFRNTATLNGLNDTWHLDFITVDTSPKTDLFNGEVAFVYDPYPLLKNYTSMPWNQFYDYQEEEFTDSINLLYRFNSDFETDISSNLYYNIFELCTGELIEQLDSNSSGGNLAGSVNTTIQESFSLVATELPDLSIDRPEDANIVIQCEYAIPPTTSALNNIYLENDTVRFNQIFANYLSYDDGSAEKGYGFVQTPGELAVAFDVNQSVELQGLQIYFTNIVNNGADQFFSIKAWSFLDFENEDAFSRNDSIISIRSGLSPIYTGELGGFTTYLFNEPVTVDSTFYVGFEQQGIIPLEVGHDVNNLIEAGTYTFGDSTDTFTITDYKHRLAGDKTFINGSGVWEPSIIPGAVMIRPILGTREIIQTSINAVELKEDYLTIYPNPANNYLTIESNNSNAQNEVRIFDYSGKMVKTYQNQTYNLPIAELPTGMYLIQLLDTQTGETKNGKFIKQ